MRVETFSEQVFFTTTLIEASNDTESWTGTGFFHSVETTAGQINVVVTNKHVLDTANSVAITVVRADGANPALGHVSRVEVESFDSGSWVGHPSAEVDVAVMPADPLLLKMQQIGMPPFFRSLDDEMFAGQELHDELDALVDVMFVGYPNGLFDSSNHLPIARQGTTATPIDVDYCGEPAFLIDASVFPGSSGSPVYISETGMYRNRGGTTVVGSRYALLGVLAAVHVRVAEGEINVVRTGLQAQFEEPIDLGIVYRASTVTETVDQLLAISGHVRQPLASRQSP